MRYFLLIAALVFGILLATPAKAQRHGANNSDDSWQSAAINAIGNEAWDDALRLLQSTLDRFPNDLNARLLRAICYREKARQVFLNSRNQFFLDPQTLKAIRLAASANADERSWQLGIGQTYDVTKSIFDFEFVLSRDSSFEDVLIEYAKLWHEHYVFDLAISLSEAQIRTNFEAPRGHEELIASYRHYIAWVPTRQALDALQRIASPYSTYFTGEVLRRDGHLQRADSIYAALTESKTLPAQPVLLSRARVAIVQGRFEEAHAYLSEALNFDTILGARLLLRDFSYVMDEGEYSKSMSLQTVDEYRDFYARMWTRRNPTPGARLNWRLIEHFRRLTTAERDYEYFGPRPRTTGRRNDSNGFGDPSAFPPLYWRTHGFNDRGLIYIRHGEPDDRIMTQPRPGIGMNESWRYQASGLDFHFFISETDGIANSWPLVPVLMDCYMAYDRREWGGFYNQLSPRPQFVSTTQPGLRSDPCGPDADQRNDHDVSIAISYLADDANADITRGLTTDRHTWLDDQIEGFEFPFDVATFRGPNELTDVSLFVALPVGYFGEKSSSDTISVELGYALLDSTWRTVEGDRSLKWYRAGHDRSAAALENFHFRVPPDSYLVAVHADLAASPLFGGYRFGGRVPDYNRAETMMSDVVLAYDIRPKPGHHPSRRSSVEITANPFHRFSTDQTIHLYFELYNLPLDENDTSTFEVTYRVDPENERGGLLSLFRRDDQSLSVTSTFEDTTPSPIILSEIDVGRLQPGAYTLTVHVRDTIFGTELARSLPLELTNGD